MKQYIKHNWKPALVAVFFMFLTLGFLFAGVGCSTVAGVSGLVRGIAQDVEDMAEGTRERMLGDNP